MICFIVLRVSSEVARANLKPERYTLIALLCSWVYLGGGHLRNMNKGLFISVHTTLQPFPRSIPSMHEYLNPQPEKALNPEP